MRRILPGLKAARRLALSFGKDPGPVSRLLICQLLSRVTPSVEVEHDGLRYYVNTSDYVGRQVFACGEFEQDIMEYTIRLIERLYGESLAGKVFIDIGANIGTSTIPAVKLFGASGAIAIEPEPSNFRLLRCNLVANDVSERVRTFRVALSDRDGLGVLELSAGNSGDHRIRMTEQCAGDLHGEASRETAPVELLRFDQLASREAIDLDRVGLVWMDTQGHEGHVMAGARSVAERRIPAVIEYWPYGLRRAGGAELLHRAVADGYRRAIDIRASMREKRLVELPASELGELENRYIGTAYTDVILL